METALIRELHVYGSLQSLKTQEESGQKVQHSGLGKQLLETAEKIAQKSDFFKAVCDFWSWSEGVLSQAGL